MRYIQLDTRPFPESPPGSSVYPYLREGDGAEKSFDFALRVPQGNGLLSIVLDMLGFKGATNEPLTCDALPTFKNQTELNKYIKLDAAELNEALVVPTAINVTTAELDHADWQAVERDVFAFLRLKTRDRVFSWADAAGKSPLLRFKLPLQTIGDMLQDVGTELAVILAPRFEDGSGKWPGYELRIADGVSYAVLDNEAAELHFGGHTLTKSADGLVLSLAVPSATVRLGSWASLKIEAPALKLTAKKQNEWDIALTPGSRDSDAFYDQIRLTADLELVMAAQSDSPIAIAEVVRLLSLDRKSNPLLSFEFELALKSPTGEEEGEEPKAIPIFTWKPPGWKMQKGFWKAIGSASAKWKDVGQAPAGLIFGGRKGSLSELVGDDFDFDFGIRPLGMLAGADRDGVVPCVIRDSALIVPVALHMQAGTGNLEFSLDLAFDLTTFRLRTNRLGIRLPPEENCSSDALVDLGAFAFMLPRRPAGSERDSLDGYFDLARREFALCTPKEFKVNGAVDRQPLGKPLLAIPGNLEGNDFSQRLLFEFQSFHPESWPEQGPNDEQIFLRINGEGLSLKGVVRTDHRPNVLKGTDSRRALFVNPQSKREGKDSEIIIINNRIARAVLYGEFEVPGVDDLLAKVEMGLSQDRRGQPPRVFAEIDFDSANGKPLANLSAGFLAIQIDDMRARMEWDLGAGEWKLSVPVDASLLLSTEVNQRGGLDDLAQPNVIRVTGLDLMNLHEGFGSITLPLPEAVSFTCLDGMFGVSLKQLTFTWGGSFTLQCSEAAFTFKNPGAFDVTIEVGGVHIEFFPGGRVKMRNPRRIGIDATISDSVRFRGEVAWVDTDTENYFAAAGTVAIQGLPEAKALLKIGTGRKLNGQVVPNIVLYGAIDYEVQLFAGVVAKSFGAGIGINNRLTGVDERPIAENLLARIDEIDPSRIDGWKFVERNGFFLSIVGTTLLASNAGGTSGTNAYVASIVLSIDIDLNIVAAARVWLACSVDFVRKKSNWSRPALVGAVALLPRERLFTAAMESRKNPAIEASDQLSQILNNGKVRIAFVLSPSLVDFHLKEVSYQANFLGVEMRYQGSFRLAVFAGTLLVRANQSITGHFSKSLEAGPGGFHCRGSIALGMEFGGLLSQRGLAAYGMIGLQLLLDVDAWIKVGFSRTIGWGKAKRTISFEKKFSLGTTRLELGLCGAAAFDESGQFGFAGTLSISVSICGYRLSISPSLAINDGVIHDVRGRVGAFEKKLDAYRAKLLQGGERTISLANVVGDAAEEPKEKWLHYQVGEWHLLVPKRDATWFTPELAQAGSDVRVTDILFRNAVTRIKLQAGDDKIELDMPWTRKSREGANNKALLEKLEEIELTMAETAAMGNTEMPPSIPDYYVVSDPRVESIDHRYWTASDQAVLPNYALPVRMKDAEQLLQAAGMPPEVNVVYGRLVEYEHWLQLAHAERRHRGEDRSVSTELEERRAVVLYEMLKALHQAADPGANAPAETVAWVAKPDHPGSGLIFRQSSPLPEEVTIFRDNLDVGKNVILEHMSTRVDEARDHVLLLPPRQELVIDRDPSGGGKDPVNGSGRGRILVRLPLKLNDRDSAKSAFINEDLSLFSHFEVFRRIRGQGEPTLIAGRQFPALTFLEPKSGDFQVDEPRHIVVAEPYLFTDVFPFVQHEDGHRQLEADIEPGKTELEYAIRLVPLGAAPEKGLKGLSAWQPVILHLPEAQSVPANLSLLFPVQSLYRPDTGWTKEIRPMFQFASLVDKNWALAAVNQEPGYQLWAEELQVPESGFYAGDVLSSPVAGDRSGYGNLSELSADEDVILTSDKVKLKIESDPGQPGIWLVHAESLKSLSGQAYRFYFRPPNGLLQRLGLLVTRELPKTSGNKWESQPSIRGVSVIEWINQETVGAVRSICMGTRNTPIAQTVPLSLSVRALEVEYSPDQTRRRVGVSWNHPSFKASDSASVRPSKAGGIELCFTDRDDTALTSTLICETLDQASYRSAIRDFSNDSAWRLTQRERAMRHNATTQMLDVEPNLDFDQYFTDQMLYLSEENPASSNLLKHTRTVKELLTSPTVGWGDLAKAVSAWVHALNEFEQSPLNLNDPVLRETIFRARAALRYIFLGVNPDNVIPGQGWDKDRIATLDETITKRLAEIEKLAPVQSDFDDPRLARLAYLDAELARKVTAIIRRRLTVSSDAMAGQGDDLPLARTEAQAMLPREDGLSLYWFRYLELSRDPEDKLHYTEQLFKWFESPNNASLRPRSEQVKEAGKGALTTLEELVVFDNEGRVSRRPLAAAIVAKGAALTQSLQILESQFASRGWRLHRRPHHRVTIVDGQDGTKRPEKLDLKALLPDGARRTDARPGSSPLQVSPEASLVCCFNLLERLGFAIDLAASDASGQLLSQAELVEAIRGAHFEQLFGTADPKQSPRQLDVHRTYLLTPREPDSEHRGSFPDPKPDSSNIQYAYSGFSFVRLALVPEAVHRWLLGGKVGHGISNDATIRLARWLKLRGIGVDANWEDPSKPLVTATAVQQFKVFASALAYADLGETTSETAIVPSLQQIRLTPLELQYVTLPHIGGLTHVEHVLPDRRRHRLHVSGRAMSRYEPFLRWAEQLPRPNVRHLSAEIEVPRILTPSDGLDLPLRLPVTNFPHPELLQFAFSLPPAGIRALLNRISAVRTGYQGYCMAFEYGLIDHEDANKKEVDQHRTWKQIIAGLVLGKGENVVPIDEPAIVVPTPRNGAIQPHLFRNQRLLTLEHVPYYYKVKLNVHGQFAGDMLGFGDKEKNRLHEEHSQFEVEPARRLPSIIAYRRPYIAKTAAVAGSQTYNITLVLTRQGEMCEALDLQSGMPYRYIDTPLKDSSDKTIRIEDMSLPEPTLGYHFYHLRSGGDVPIADRVYESVIDLLMPWHEAYQVKNPNGGNPVLARPFVRSHSSFVKILEPYPEVQWCHKGEMWVPVVSVAFSIESPDLFHLEKHRFVQVSCRGKLTPITHVLEEQHNG